MKPALSTPIGARVRNLTKLYDCLAHSLFEPIYPGEVGELLQVGEQVFDGKLTGNLVATVAFGAVVCTAKAELFDLC